jgi:glycosyltransferase involved in cell wall biosynthesis
MSDVSCIIPYYNGGDTVARAIDSVIHSPNCLEVVVVVDASPQPLEPHLTPGQQELVGTGRLRIIRLGTNHGQGSARNLGAAVSVGAFVSFLDQDDMYLPGYYEAAVAFLRANPSLAAVEAGAEYVQDGRIVLDHPDPRYGSAINSVPWNVVVRRGAFWSCGAFPVGPEFRTAIAAEDVAFKIALKRWFLVGGTTRKFIRHHIREGSATDRYLRRTEVVNGQVVFRAVADNEADGSLQRAIDVHLRRVWLALQAQRAMGARRPST